MKKKFSALLLSVALIFSMVPVSAVLEAEPFIFTDASGITWKCTVTDEENKTVSIELTDENEISGAVTIPDKVTLDEQSYRVTEIGDDAFKWWINLTSVEIPEGVTTIGEEAFEGVRDLTSVTIPKSVTTISDDAFKWCRKLTSVEIPEGVTEIGSGAFVGCDILPEFTVDPNNAHYCAIDGVLFTKDKKKLIHYPPGKTATTYTIPDTVDTIGNCAFYECNILTSVKIPGSVTKIGSSAFVFCDSLTSMEIEEGVTEIGFHAVSSCTKLKSVKIPSSVTKIGSNAFINCRSLSSVTIPKSVEMINRAAFCLCGGLKTVFYPKGLDVSEAFYPDRATKIAYTVTDAKSNPLKIKPVTIYGGSGSDIVLCEHSAGPNYKLVEADPAITGLTVETTWDSINGQCENCGTACEHMWRPHSGKCERCGAINPKSLTLLQTEIKDIFEQDLKLLIENPNGALSEGTRPVAEWVKPDTPRHKEIVEMRDLTHEAEKIVFLEITLLDKDGNPLPMPLSDKVHVLLQIPKGFDKDEIQVALVKSGADVEFDEAVVTKDGVDYIGFWSDHFSPYTFVDTLSAEEKNALDNNNDNNSTTSGTTSTQTVPKTGDSYIEFYIAFSSLLMASAALVFMSLKRKARHMK